MMGSRFEPLAVPQLLDEPRQIRLFRRGAHARGRFGCPIGLKKGGKVPAVPKRCTHYGEQPLEAVIPSVHERQTTHEQMNQQSHPDLPSNGVGTMAEEVGELKRLLNLLEEDLDVPTAAVKFGHRPRAPFQVVGYESDLDLLAVDFDEGHDTAQSLGIIFLRFLNRQFDDLVAQDAFISRGFERAHHLVLHVVLGPTDPPDASFRQLEEVLELVVGLVEHGDFAGFEGGAKLSGLRAIMVFGRVDNGALGQKALQIQTQMTFGCGLPATVFRPVHTVGDQLDRGRVDRVDRLAEPAEIAPAHLAFGKPRNRVHQMLHHIPVERLGHVRVANLIGVTQIIARWGNRPAKGRKCSFVHLERIAHIVESDRMGKVGVHQRNYMAPRCERPASGFYAMLLRKVRDHVPGNQIAQLLQGCIPMSGWFVFLSLFFHTLRVEDLDGTYQPFRLNAMG